MAEMVKDEDSVKRYCAVCKKRLMPGTELFRIPVDGKADKLLCAKCFPKLKDSVHGQCRECKKLNQDLAQNKIGRWVCKSCLGAEGTAKIATARK